MSPRWTAMRSTGKLTSRKGRVDKVGIGARNTEKAARRSTSEPLLALGDGF